MQRLGSCCKGDFKIFDIGRETELKKKRFIRLVMSYGIQRNEAERMARNVAAFGSYERLYTNCRFGLTFRSAIFAFRRMGKEFESAAEKQFNAFKVAFAGIDLASGSDKTAVLHHPRADGFKAGAVVFDEMAEHGTLQAMTREEHAAAHAAGRSV